MKTVLKIRITQPFQNQTNKKQTGKKDKLKSTQQQTGLPKKNKTTTTTTKNKQTKKQKKEENTKNINK